MLRAALQLRLGAGGPSARTATMSLPFSGLLLRSTASAGSSSIAQSPAGSRALRTDAAHGPGGSARSNARGGQQQQQAGAPGSPFIKAAAIAFAAAATAAVVGAAAAQGPAVRDLQQLPPAAGAHTQGEEVGLVATPGPYTGIQLSRRTPAPGEVVTADNVHVGLVVRRGPDWDRIYTNWIAAGQDGGPGSNGVVTRIGTSGTGVTVQWPATGREMACLIRNAPGWRELVVAPAEVQQEWPQQWRKQ
ncbi:hypothetical protein HXX76_005760 [Chlamydomonas incerta]|uniref:Uncharacterized protein n=1 Tax=Chlamydomonas incerta TaxID=51695 RepID=A0A835T709_CHLIN|nr:hypothetical protein HXX76_005760 [Chlamydomonas incerta]|eukprot:KAG2438152.1 hypothetical protein HXX76_005760 [Chlamydomonas incerta]